MHRRSQYRAAVRAALVAEPVFAGFTVLSAWSQNIDKDTLPVLGVATPSETKDVDTLGSATVDTQLVVVAKVSGGEDLEDALDDLSEPIELAVIGVLDDEERQCQLRMTDTVLDGAGEKRVGTITMTFSVVCWPAEPLTI